jgi:hypothetical protein
MAWRRGTDHPRDISPPRSRAPVSPLSSSTVTLTNYALSICARNVNAERFLMCRIRIMADHGLLLRFRGALMAEFVRFELDDGSQVLFETAESDLVTSHGGEPDVAEGGRLRARLTAVATAAEEIAESLRSRLAPDEVAPAPLGDCRLSAADGD